MGVIQSKIRLRCPECDTLIRLNDPPRRGKKVRCPECEHAFWPDDEDETTRFQEKPNGKPKSLARSDADPDEKPRNKRDKHDDDRDTDGRRTKKKEKPKSNMMMLIVGGLGLVGGGGALLSCCLCGLGAFVWPGWLMTKNNELFAFVAPDANLVAGGNPKQLKEKFAGFNDLFAKGQAGGNDMVEMQDLMARSDNFVMFFNTRDFGFGQPKSMVVIVKAPAVDVDKFKASKVVGAAKTLNGQTFHSLNNPKGNFGAGPKLVGFPNSQTVVLADLTDERMAETLSRGKKAPPSSAAIDLARTVHTAPMWMAFAFDGEAQRGLRDMFEKAGRGSGAMRDAAPAVENSKGLTVTLDAHKKNDMKITASMKCKNSQDATKVKAGLEDGWNTVKGLMKLGMMAGAGNQPGVGRAGELMVRDLDSMTFKSSGDSATVTLVFAADTIEELARAGKAFPGGGLGGGPFGPPPRPPVNPPPQPPFNPPPGKFNPNVSQQAILGFDGTFRHNGQLAQFDPRNHDNKIHRQYAVRLEANRLYQIDLVTNNFDAYLYLLDDAGIVLRRDDDGGQGLNSRILYTPLRTGTYYIQATSLGGDRIGNYTLTIQRR